MADTMVDTTDILMDITMENKQNAISDLEKKKANHNQKNICQLSTESSKFDLENVFKMFVDQILLKLEKKNSRPSKPRL